MNSKDDFIQTTQVQIFLKLIENLPQEEKKHYVYLKPYIETAKQLAEELLDLPKQARF